MVKCYCLDSNVFIEAWNKYYSIAIFPKYRATLDKLAKDGVIFAPIQVRDELQKVDDGLKARIKERPYLFRSISTEVQKNMSMILGTHPNLVDNIHYRSLADPWVIAFAMANNAVVVTKEYPVGNGSKKIRIPDVCEYYKIPWMDDFTFLPDIGFSY